MIDFAKLQNTAFAALAAFAISFVCIAAAVGPALPVA